MAPGPDFRHVKWVKTEILSVGLIRLHNLHVSSPHYFLTFFDGVPKLPLGIVRILTGNSDCFGLRELFLTMLRQEMILDIDKLALFVDPTNSLVFHRVNHWEANSPFEGMAAITMFVDPAIWCAMIAEEHQSGVISIFILARIVESHKKKSYPSGVQAKRSKVAS